MADACDYMDADVADFLVGELERQFKEFPLDDAMREELRRTLESTPILESSRLAEEPSDNQKYSRKQSFETSSGIKMNLYTTRIIRNRNVSSPEISAFKLFFGRIGSKLGGYSSEIVLSNLCKDPSLVEMLRGRAESKFKLMQLSALFKYSKDDYSSPEEEVHREMPILIVPAVSSEEMYMIDEFETKETRGHVIEHKGINGLLFPLRLAHYLRRSLEYRLRKRFGKNN